jgi:predicted transcriptional regulator of viral defense system
MKHDSLLKDILRSNQTVFSIKELYLIWGKAEPALLRSRLHYYEKKGYLYHLRRGLYAKNKDYDTYEVATKILTPAYISFETVLFKAGILFQWYERIFVASYQTRVIECDGNIYDYKTIKKAILTDIRGIKQDLHYSIAIPERALLDTLYLYGDYWFDNLSEIKWEKVFELLPVYDSKRMEKQILALHQSAKEQS